MPGCDLRVYRNDIVVFRAPEHCRSKFASLSAGRFDPAQAGTGALARWQQAWKRRRLRRHTPLRPSLNFTKRVVAIAGDEIAVRRGLLYVNGEVASPEARRSSTARCRGHARERSTRVGREEERTPLSMRASYSTRPTVVPERHVWVLGDCRDVSFDSHVWGPLPVQNIVGHVRACYWPAERAAFFRRGLALR